MKLTKRNIPTTYAEAQELLGRRDQRRISTNGLLWRINGSPFGDIRLRLHGTDVVTFHADGTLTLRTGGYRTVTTKAWMNAALRGTRFRVYQHKYQWHISRFYFESEEQKWYSIEWPAPAYRDAAVTLNPAAVPAESIKEAS